MVRSDHRPRFNAPRRQPHPAHLVPPLDGLVDVNDHHHDRTYARTRTAPARPNSSTSTPGLCGRTAASRSASPPARLRGLPPISPTSLTAPHSATIQRLLMVPADVPDTHKAAPPMAPSRNIPAAIRCCRSGSVRAKAVRLWRTAALWTGFLGQVSRIPRTGFSNSWNETAPSVPDSPGNDQPQPRRRLTSGAVLLLLMPRADLLGCVTEVGQSAFPRPPTFPIRARAREMQGVIPLCCCQL